MHEVKRVRGKNILWLYLAMILVASAFMTSPVISTGPTMIYIEPDTNQTNPGEYFFFDVKVANVPAPGAAVWEFKLTWDIDLTEFYASASVWEFYITEGDFLSSVGETSMGIHPEFAFKYIQVGNHLNVEGSATGDGTLCSIVLYCKESGVSDLHLFDTFLTTEDMVHLDHETADGYFYTTKPFVDFTVTPPNPLPGEEATFDASACWDPDGVGPLPDITDYAWDFGDSGTGSGMIATHTYMDYSQDGYPVTLTVTDNDGEVWSKTKMLKIWRDMAAVDIWPTNFDWGNTYTDVYRGMIDPWAGIPYMEFITTTTNFGTVTETYHLYLYMDLDTAVIGDEITLMDDTLTLGPGKGSGFSHWGYLMLDDSLPACGLYTLTAIVSSTNDQNPTNDIMQTTLYVHADTEPVDDGLHVESRRYKINPRQPGMKLCGKVKNMEDPALPIDGVWARLVFEMLTPEGMLITVKTNAAYVENGEQSKMLTAHWYPTTEDIGTYEAIVYSEFGSDGISFPCVGQEVKTISFEIKE